MTRRKDGRQVSRRQFLKWGAAGGASVMAAPAVAQKAAPAEPPRGPNFLFIITDQQGLDTLSAHGCKDVHTPHLDQLAARGVSFMESYATNPLCSPARSSMFTGRMPSETGVIRNSQRIRRGIPTVGHLLRQEGYETVFAGKWHLPREYTRRVPGFRTLLGGGGWARGSG